jgi:hypothetical protein
MASIILLNIDKNLKQKIKKILENEKINIIEEESIIINGIINNKEYIKNINYVNIEGRCLAYHLINKEVKYSKSMINSFLKEIHPLENKNGMYQAGYGIFVNLLNISAINIFEKIIYFENGD